jgi:hypothetical protein
MAIHDATHPTYDAHHRDWQLVQRMVTGEGAEHELVQRYFEHQEHYEQRQDDADFTPRTRFLTSRLAGMLFQRAEDVDRDLGPLSDDDLETAGPDGEDYTVLLLELAETLLQYNTAVVVLNPKRGLHITTPLSMPHWTSEEAVILGTRTQADDVFEDGTEETSWTRYMPDGWEVYVEEDDKDQLVDQGTYAEDDAFFVDENGRPAAPVLRLQLPWKARVGLQIAKKHRSIYRMTSRRDFAVSAAMNGLIQLGVGDNTDLSDDIEHRLRHGMKVLPYDNDYGPHKGLSMPTDGAELGTQVLTEKQKELNRVAYNELEEGARTAQSATEAQIKHQGAAAAALSVVAETMADAEMRILRLMAQAADFRTFAGPQPTDPGVSASWPADYSDVVGAGEDDLARRIFGSRLPADVETASQIVVDQLRDEGYDPNEDEIRRRVEGAFDRESQSPTTSFLG